MASGVTINSQIIAGGTLNAGGITVPLVKNTVTPTVVITSTATHTGPQGPAGPTGGIVPITVSASAPSSPSLNDLWIDIS